MYQHHATESERLAPVVGLEPVTAKVLDTIKDQSPEIKAIWAQLKTTQQYFVMLVLQDLPHYEAYRIAYDLPKGNKRSLESMASQCLRSKSIAPIIAAIQDHRATDLLRILDVYRDATEATRTIQETTEDPVTHELTTTYVKVPDYAVRLKGADLLTKLHGLNAPTRVETDIRSTVIRYHRPVRDQVSAIDVSRETIAHQVTESITQSTIEDLGDPDDLSPESLDPGILEP